MRLIDADKLIPRCMFKGRCDSDGGLRCDGCMDYSVEYQDIKNAPTIAPEPHWIPCGERMPEEHEWIGTKHFGTTISNEVYVTFETPDGQRFVDHISFQNGKLSRSDAEKMRVWYKGAKPIAWQPFPELYKGDSNG